MDTFAGELTLLDLFYLPLKRGLYSKGEKGLLKRNFVCEIEKGHKIFHQKMAENVWSVSCPLNPKWW